jgi:hypothetical protein
MKKGYWVVVYRSVSDESAVKAYGALAAGGRVIRRTLSEQVYEPDSNPRGRIAVADDRRC